MTFRVSGGLADEDGVIVGHAGGQVNRDGVEISRAKVGREAVGFVAWIGRHTPGAEAPFSCES